MRRLVFGLSTGLLLASAPVALAHVQLRAPIQRETAQKDGPCGAVASVRGATTCSFRPGTTITIAFDETVEHEGHFRVSFDDDGQDFVNPTTPADTDPTVLINDLPDKVTTSQADWGYTVDITFPNVECDNCTLQVIQVMSTAATYEEADLYYQCADIVLSNAAPATPDPACVAPPPDEDPPDDGGDGDGSGDGDGTGDGDGSGDGLEHSGVEGGCAIAAGSGRGLTGSVLLLLGALLLQGRRRRR